MAGLGKNNGAEIPEIPPHIAVCNMGIGCILRMMDGNDTPNCILLQKLLNGAENGSVPKDVAHQQMAAIGPGQTHKLQTFPGVR